MMKNSEDQVTQVSIPESLYVELRGEARALGQNDIDDYIAQLLKNRPRIGNLEDRQITGNTVKAESVNRKLRLVLIRGIYYHYRLETPGSIDNNAKYMITKSDGNILTLKKI